MRAENKGMITMALTVYQKPIRSRTNNTHAARVDIIENSDAFIVRANVPGFTKEEIEIEVDFESLKITASREISEDDITYLHRERFGNKLARTMTFKKPVDANKAEVTLENGVLEIVLPFAEAAKTVKLTL